MILIVCLLLAVNFYVSVRARKRDKAANDNMAKMWQKLNYIGGIMSDFSYGKDIRLFGMKHFILQKYLREQKERFRGSAQIQNIWLSAKNTYAVTSLLQESLLYAWLCWRVIKGGMSIGDFTMFAAAIRTFSSSLGGLLDDLSHIKQQNEVICDFRTFLELPNLNPGQEHLPATLANSGCAFTFNHVSFRYPGRTEYALRDITIEIKAGERLVVVGLNGAGNRSITGYFR